MEAFPTSTTSNSSGLRELVFIPAPGAGHIVSTVELAKLLVNRDHLLSVTILVMKLPYDSAAVDTYVQSAASFAPERIRFIDLPRDDSASHLTGTKLFFPLFMETQKPLVKEAMTQLVQNPSHHRPRLAGLVIDMFCTNMIDVANELGVPSYMFFTSSASFLGLTCHIQSLHDHSHVDVTDLDADVEMEIPTLKKPVQVKLFPSMYLDKDVGFHAAMTFARRFRETQGIIVNTFSELEPYAINSVSRYEIPTIYPVGPILDVKKSNEDESVADIMTWLDKQPASSVVFLCFGSMGSFGEDQLKEIARGLELSGHRFLWSMRRSPPNGKFEFPKDYENPEEVLPEGFLNRTAEIGKIIGWAPQTAVLAHPAVGSFVSHCGWNSTLESLWFGVPVATWPLYAEQQYNAFQLVKELGIAMEIKLDYKRDLRRIDTGNEVIVSAEEIEGGVRRVMEKESEMRKKVKELKEMSQKAVQEGGSSHNWLGRFIEDVTENMPRRP